MNGFNTTASLLLNLCLCGIALCQAPAVPARQTGPNNMRSGQPTGAAAGQPSAQQRIPIVTPGQAVQDGVAQVVQQPFAQLTAQEQAFVDQVLDVWEKRTDKVKRYECKFMRWQFDPTVDPKHHSSLAEGELKFMDPDKGLFRVDQVQSIAGKGDQPTYRVDPRRPYGEYWVCDGDWVHILDRNEKKANRIQLPPQMRGQQIHLSPLPFLFGVNANEIKQRYWLRTLKPPAGDDSVWLEAWPKRADDAGNYSRVQVVLDRKDILPRALIVFLPNWRPTQQHREVYEFSGRQDTAGFWDAVKERVFRQEFIPTKLPSDWNVIEEPYVPPQEATVPGQGSPNARQQRVAQPPNAATQQPISR